MGEDLDSKIIKATQASLGKFVKRPALTDKLLNKPPFRFLHDIITTVIKSNGFFEGLFNEDELKSENVKDKEAKILFLTKVIAVLNLATNRNVTAKPSKIVAGQESDKTNELLQCLAYALENNISSNDAVAQFKNGVNSAETKQNVNKNTKDSKETSNLESKSSDSLLSRRSIKDNVNQKNKEPSIIKKNNRDSSTNRQNNRDQIAIKKKTSDPSFNRKSNREGSIIKKDVKDKAQNKVKVKNQDSLEKILNNPLKKKNTLEINDHLRNETESANRNLFSSQTQSLLIENQIQSEQSKNPDLAEETLNEVSGIESPKRNFQIENISTGGHQLIEDVKSKSELTNDFKDDTFVPTNETNSHSDVSTKILLEPKTDPPSSSHNQNALDANNLTKTTDQGIESQNGIVATPTAPEQNLEKVVINKKEDIANLNKVTTETENANIVEPRRNTPPVRPSTGRPPSSRPGAPRLKEKHEDIIAESANVPVAKVNIITEGHTENEEEDSLVVVESNAEAALEAEPRPAVGPSGDQGHLVQQILNSQKELSQLISGKTEIEWELGAQRGREASGREAEALKLGVQALSRAAAPLGRLLDYVHEDVEVMRQELLQWRGAARAAAAELAAHAAANEEAMHPLIAKIKVLNSDIAEKREKINDLKTQIYKNTLRIDKLLASENVQ